MSSSLEIKTIRTGLKISEATGARRDDIFNRPVAMVSFSDDKEYHAGFKAMEHDFSDIENVFDRRKKWDKEMRVS